MDTIGFDALKQHLWKLLYEKVFQVRASESAALVNFGQFLGPQQLGHIQGIYKAKDWSKCYRLKKFLDSYESLRALFIKKGSTPDIKARLAYLST